MDRYSVVGLTVQGLKITDFLGRGVCGLAYKTDLNTVLKFASWSEEKILASEILKGNLAIIEPYLCKFYGMAECKLDIDYMSPTHIIHKELVLPVGEHPDTDHPVWKWIEKLPKEAFKVLNIWDYDEPRNIGVNSKGEFKIYDPMFRNTPYNMNENLFNNLNWTLNDVRSINHYSNETLAIAI